MTLKRPIESEGEHLQAKDDEVSRRRFLGSAAACTASLALKPSPGAAHVQENRTRTLFFNLSHEDHEGHTYYLVLGKHRHRLETVHPAHPGFARARRANPFLRALPPGLITHVIEDIRLPADEVLLSYTIKDPDTTSGTWAMSSIYLLVPRSSISRAYGRARKHPLGEAPLPLSAKRMKYGVRAAESLDDLLDEQDLVDSTDWAKAMVNVHPEMLCAEPDSAAHIQTNLIDARSIFQLSQQLELAGPATPQQSRTPSDSQNPNGWATLVAFTDTDNVTPLKNTKGNNKGLILYDARWQPSINTFVAAAMRPTSAAVKNDPTLGADVTGGLAALRARDLKGTIWCRHDGVASTAATQSTANVLFTLTNITPHYNGYSLSATSEASSVTLKFTNWYLRWLGVYAEFYNGSQAIPSKDIQGISAAKGLDEQYAVFLGILTPEFTIFGIPVMSSQLPVTFTFPPSATSAGILASGLGYGPHTHQDTETVGIVTTSIFNLILPGLLLAMGLGTSVDVFTKQVVLGAIATQGFLVEFFALCEGATGTQLATIFWRLFVRGATSAPAVNTFIASINAFLIEGEAVEAAEDAIPIVGAIIQAIGALGTVAELAETAAEVGLSPRTYEYRLMGTHNLNVTVHPDPKDKGGFPPSAATYNVVAIFDNATPQVQTLSMPGTLPAVQFQGVQLGGNVTVNVAFYDAQGALVGNGAASGINNEGAEPTITIAETPLPIQSGTIYQHKQKTTLDQDGNHMWACAAAPATAPAECGPNAGSLCDLRSITVSPLGYVGYDWQSFDNTGCTSAGAQLDQMANIFVANESGGNAQKNYATTPCGLEPGTNLVYDPLGRAGANYYLDRSNGLNLIRQIELAPPAFADPHSKQAWGGFNLDSDDLLLHPAGALISINSATSRMESLRLPDKSVTDAQAAVSLLANLHGGQGTRPGLFNAPTVATITSDGVILIVESGNNRIHAVDLVANPVRHFSKQRTPYFLNFKATGGGDTQYLDIAAEFSGFIYVLSSSNSVYRLDIYHPDQTGTDPISTTMGFNAAKVAVDYFRNVYSLNYEVLMFKGGLPPSGVTEPSISQWIPTTPPTCVAGVSSPFPTSSVRNQRLLRRRDLWTPFEATS
jgi:hypothetical protein